MLNLNLPKYLIIATFGLFSFTSVLAGNKNVNRCTWALEQSNSNTNSRTIKWRLLSKKYARKFSFYADQRYGEYGSISLQKLASLGPNFRELITDPGLVLRVDDFISYVRKNQLEKKKPWTVRNLYSDHLGSRIVYRAVNLPSRRVALSALQKGMLSRALRSSQGLWQDLDIFPIEWAIQSRISGGEPNPHEFMLSITETPEIAIAVANKGIAFENAFGEPDLKVFLYKVILPEIDILYADPSHPSFVPQLMGKFLLLKNKTGNRKKIAIGRQVEAFVPYKIDADEIEFVKSIKSDWTFDFVD